MVGDPSPPVRRRRTDAVVPFNVGQCQLDAGFGDLAVQINLWMHILGSGAVIAIVLLPAGHDWVTALRRR